VIQMKICNHINALENKGFVALKSSVCVLQYCGLIFQCVILLLNSADTSRIFSGPVLQKRDLIGVVDSKEKTLGTNFGKDTLPELSEISSPA
jgi:hypothetical protein